MPIQSKFEMYRLGRVNYRNGSTDYISVPFARSPELWRISAKRDELYV
jgi:hypothetical protein